LKRLGFVLFLCGFLLTACAGQEASAPSQRTPGVSLPSIHSTTPPAECVALNIEPTPDATLSAYFPPAAAGDWRVGSEEAAVTFIMYGDFQCPYCAQLYPVLFRLQMDFPDDVQVVFRHIPLSSHDKAVLAAQAAEAAGKQGHFFEMAEKLYAEQAGWVELTPQQFSGWLEDAAAAIGLDGTRFRDDFNSSEVRQRVSEAKQAVEHLIPGTPFLLINGEPYINRPRNYESLATIVEFIRLQKRQFTDCPPMQIRADHRYTATLQTEKGDIVIELYPQHAPMAVNSFVFLARQGWFDGMTFHRVIPGFVAQTGDPSGTGGGHAGYYFDNEISDLRFDKSGVVGMANSGPNTNGSQFFITYVPLPGLDGKYTVFGQVVAGMDVVQRLTPRDPAQGGSLPPGDLVKRVTINEQ